MLPSAAADGAHPLPMLQRPGRMPTVNLMPRKNKIAPTKTATKPAAKTPLYKTKFILALPTILAAKDVVAKAKASVNAAPAAKTVKVKAKPTKVAAPKATLAPAKVAKPTKSTTKTAYVLGFPPGTPAADVVAAGKAKGIKLSTAHVYAIRTAAKAKAKKGKVTSAPVKVKPGKAQPSARKAAPRPAPSAPAPSAIAGIDPLDLAYAVGRLVAEGRTTAAEVARLAAERTSWIGSLEAELAALRDGQVPMGEVVTIGKPVKARKALKPGKRVLRRAAKAKTAVKPVAEPKRTKAKAVKGKVTTRVDGRKFTMTAKALAARKLQGTYLGHLRQVPEIEKPAFKTIAKEEGVAAAVAELKKRLGKK